MAAANLPPTPPGWTFLGCSDKKSVSKIVLEALAGDLPPPKSALDLYRSYLSSVVSFGVSYRTVGMLDDYLLSRFYVQDEPSCPPKYFDALESSGGDLAKMERSARRRLILLTPSLSSRDRWDDSVLYKIHDRRIWTTLLDGGIGDVFAESGPPVVLVIVKLPGLRGRNQEVYRLDATATEKQYRAVWSERFLRQGRSQLSSGCLLHDLARALGGGSEAAVVVPLPHDCPRGRFCVSLGALTARPWEAHAAMGSPATSFSLVTHQRTQPMTIPAKMRLTTSNCFFLLSVLGSGRDISPTPDMPVLGITASLDVYRLKPEYAVRAVSSDAGRTASQGNAVPPRHHTSSVPPGPVGRVLADAMRDTARQRRQANLPVPEGVGPAAPAAARRCSCHVCSQSVRHEDNMSANGRQALYRCQFGVFELMRVLGRLDATTERDLLRACRYATASFDVESVSTPVESPDQGDDAPSRPAAGLRQPEPIGAAAPHNPDQPDRGGGGSGSSGGGTRRAYAVHEPVLVGLVDWLSVEDVASGEVPAEPSAAVSIYSGPDMMSDFLNGMTESRERSVTVRYGILSEHFSWVERYRRQHYEFYAQRGFISAEAAEAASVALHDGRDHRVLAGQADDDALLDAIGREVVAELAAAAANAAPSADHDGNRSEWGGGGGGGSSSGGAAVGPSASPRYDDDDDDDDGDVDEHGDEVLLAPLVDPDDDDNDQNDRVAEWARRLGRRVRDEDAAKRLAKIQRAWSQSLLGLLEARLHALCRGFYVFGFNASSFDNIILCSRLVTLAKQRGYRSVGMQREGSSIRFLTVDGIRLCEAKRLACPGTSLASLGRACELDVAKGIFPFDLFTHLSFLDEPQLPPDASSWKSALASHKNPTQAEVDAARMFYDASGFQTVGHYLRHYLSLDCIVLLRSLDAMHTRYYDILGLSFVESRKLTVSSLANTGAQTWLARRKRPGAFVCNHARIYGVSFVVVSSHHALLLVVLVVFFL